MNQSPSPEFGGADFLSIVLPVHNQGDHIEAVVAGYQAALSKLGCRHELILVSNACRDQSPAICRELAPSREQVRAIDTPEKGWGRAVKLGLRAGRRDMARLHELRADHPGSVGDHRPSGDPESRVRRQGLQARP